MSILVGLSVRGCCTRVIATLFEQHAEVRGRVAVASVGGMTVGLLRAGEVPAIREFAAAIEAIGRASRALVDAATAAMGAGYSLTEIARAEAGGKDEVKHALSGDALRRVERSGRQAREAQLEHHRAIARAVRLGLSTREIAAAANVTHGTIRAITNRLAAAGAGADPASEEQSGEPDQE